MKKIIFLSTLALILFGTVFFTLNNTEAKDATEIGQCMGDCASELGICISQCNGDGQCISRCAASPWSLCRTV